MSSPAPVAVAVASWNTRDLLAEYLGTVLLRSSRGRGGLGGRPRLTRRIA